MTLTTIIFVLTVALCAIAGGIGVWFIREKKCRKAFAEELRSIEEWVGAEALNHLIANRTLG